jgi:hypothetical protein
MRQMYALLTLLVTVACSAAIAGSRIEYGSHAHAVALRDGAKAQVTFRIVDQVGNLVTGASVQVSFVRRGCKWVYGISDENGLYLAKGKSNKILYCINKEGYYPTETEYTFGGEGNIVLNDGHWLPWNQTNTVILKKVINPVAMFAYVDYRVVPVKGTNVAFDLENADWLPPYGKGVYADLIVNFDHQWTDAWTGFRKMQLTFGTNALDGVRRYTADDFSKLKSIYEAPVDGYEKSVSWSMEGTKGEKTVFNVPPDSEYFIFRVRTEVDEKGKIVKANYGKIYGPVGYGMRGPNQIVLYSYFNPEVNSRNLEFDPEKNLSGQKIPCP